mmetsp:Transcript_80690/g.193518  ORF Transcript_80690/g.193518 Transcript_80690/m.193518 type:complete len:255 (-) Transcript_80690:5954-6718(-)
MAREGSFPCSGRKIGGLGSLQEAAAAAERLQPRCHWHRPKRRQRGGAQRRRWHQAPRLRPGQLAASTWAEGILEGPSVRGTTQRHRQASGIGPQAEVQHSSPLRGAKSPGLGVIRQRKNLVVRVTGTPNVFPPAAPQSIDDHVAKTAPWLRGCLGGDHRFLWMERLLASSVSQGKHWHRRSRPCGCWRWRWHRHDRRGRFGQSAGDEGPQRWWRCAWQGQGLHDILLHISQAMRLKERGQPVLRLAKIQRGLGN